MIITEERIRDIVSQMPKIRVNDDVSSIPNFHWGDRSELVKYLELKKDAAYPLIWLLPSVDNHVNNGFLCNKECMFIVATRETRKDLMNNERFDISYRVVLNPVLDYLLQGLDGSTISRLISSDWSVERLPDFTESYYKNDNDNYTIDLWDAIKFTCDVEFNNHCLKEILWQVKSIS